MRILDSLRREMDFESAVADELRTVNRLLPPPLADRALVGHEEEVASWATALARRDFHPESEEVILTRKLGRGGRPNSLLGLHDRIVYRAAVGVIEESLPDLDRSPEAHDRFQRAPLGVKDTEYVLKADVASFYQFIDHEQLIHEIVAQTADDLPIELAVRVIESTSSRRFGLPQLNSASDVLSDVYIDPMRRELIRTGFNAFRFADDFRVAAGSYAEALAALEATDMAARAIGLVLNEMKTSTPGLSRYETSLSAVSKREQSLFEDLNIELLNEFGTEDYAEDEVGELEQLDSLLEEPPSEENELGLAVADDDEEEAVTDAQITAALAVLELWQEEEEDEEVQSSESARVTARLLERSLRVLALASDTSALASAAAMLVYEPSLTPTISRYLRECGRSEPAETRATLDDIVSSDITSTWQDIWLAYVAGELPRTRGERRGAQAGWLRSRLQSASPALRAEACLAIGRRRLASQSLILDVIQALPAKHRGTGLLALSAYHDEAIAMSAADSELDRIRVGWGLRRLGP